MKCIYFLPGMALVCLLFYRCDEKEQLSQANSYILESAHYPITSIYFIPAADQDSDQLPIIYINHPSSEDHIKLVLPSDYSYMAKGLYNIEDIYGNDYTKMSYVKYLYKPDYYSVLTRIKEAQVNIGTDAGVSMVSFSALTADNKTIEGSFKGDIGIIYNQ